MQLTGLTKINELIFAGSCGRGLELTNTNLNVVVGNTHLKYEIRSLASLFGLGSTKWSLDFLASKTIKTNNHLKMN